MRLSQVLSSDDFRALKDAIDDVDIWYRENCFPIDQVKEIMSWNDINRIVATHDMFGRELVLAKDGVAVNPIKPVHFLGRDTEDLHIKVGNPKTFADYIRRGFSLVLNGTQRWHAPIGRLCADLGRDLFSDVRANVYASWVKESPFGIHWDEHDVLVVQLDGEKHWKVFGGGHDFPMSHALHRKGEQPPSDTVLDVVLKPGSMLYLPRGCWHEALTKDLPSLHLTIGIRRFTALDLFDWLKIEGQNNPSFRSNVPTLADDATLLKYIEELVRAIPDLLGEDGVKRFRHALQLKVTGRPFISLPVLGGQFTADYLQGRNFRLERWIEIDDALSDEENVVLTDGRTHWSLPRPIGNALPKWLSGESVCFSELLRAGGSANLHEMDVFGIVTDMLDEGVLYADV